MTCLMSTFYGNDSFRIVVGVLDGGSRLLGMGLGPGSSLVLWAAAGCRDEFSDGALSPVLRSVGLAVCELHRCLLLMATSLL